MDNVNCIVVRGFADSCVKGLSQDPNKGAVCLEGAKEEHQYTKDVITKLGLKLYEVPKDEQYPDCVFIEDPVFFLDGVAFLTRAGHPSRRGEKEGVKKFIEEHFPKLKIVEMVGEDAHMDGGDILYIGGEQKEILCGVSTRTNLAGIAQLQAAFPAYTVTPIPVPEVKDGGLLHLITHCSQYAPGGHLVIGKSAASQKIKQTILEKAKTKCEFFEVPDDWAANCSYINGHVLHCSEEEYPQSFKLFQEKFGDKAVPMKNKQFDRIDGSLTCRIRQLSYDF